MSGCYLFVLAAFFSTVALVMIGVKVTGQAAALPFGLTLQPWESVEWSGPVRVAGFVVGGVAMLWLFDQLGISDYL